MTDFYRESRYFELHPDSFAEDNAWKLGLILPYVSRLLGLLEERPELRILDIGAGNGVILQEVSEFVRNRGVAVRKYAMDPDPGMLRVCLANNPDLVQGLSEDVRKSSIETKGVDISLLIDVLEHVPGTEAALRELSRISRYAIMTVPLEDNWFSRVYYSVRRGRKLAYAEHSGHLKSYTVESARNEIQENAGDILEHKYGNSFAHRAGSRHYRETMNTRSRALNWLGLGAHQISPWLSARLFTDSVVFLVRCH